MGTPAVPTGPLVVVDDPEDPRLGDYRALNDVELRRRWGADDGVVVVEGRVAVGQLLTSSYEVRSLLVDDHQAGKCPELVEAVRARGAPVYVGRRPVVAATVGFALHRGVVATARRPPPAAAQGLVLRAAGSSSVGGGPPMVVVLEGVNDHENLGALFRNAAAFGVGAVLLSPTCADPLYRRSVRVSVGHALHVPFARLAPWPDALAHLGPAGFTLAALAPERSAAAAGRRPVTPRELAARLTATRRTAPGVALLLGAEGPGLSPAALAHADEVVAIPMAPGVDSLNVATAAAVAFHRLAEP
jgi:tRNA G18 (ribose-2'-O)-methylase SpoU